METGRILLTRHAEKRYDRVDTKLSPAGSDRAQKFAQYIPATFGKPDFLFATVPSKRSERPYLTLKPLSKAMDIAIEARYVDQDYAALADHLLARNNFRGKLLVVCWHHGHILSFARALGAKTRCLSRSVAGDCLQLDPDIQFRVRCFKREPSPRAVLVGIKYDDD